ncbi:MAG: hypothetical protein ABW095_18550 [Candidatus Thiodiazotropha sp.]
MRKTAKKGIYHQDCKRKPSEVNACRPDGKKKLVVGDVLEEDIYEHGKIITTDGKGLVTISIEGKLIRLIENTREIVEILGGM